MKSKASSEAVVVLKGGFVASLRALRLGWALEPAASRSARRALGSASAPRIS
jgi:hypothetical protein